MSQTVIEKDADAAVYDTLKTDDGLKLFTIRKRGTSHRSSGTVCQDYCLSEKVSEHLVVSAVADGHGGSSYIYSDIGAKLACETLIKLVKEFYLKSLRSNLAEDDIARVFTSQEFRAELVERWRAAVMEAFRKLMQTAGQDEAAAEPSEKHVMEKFGTTLLFAIVMRNWIIAGQNGDGSILLFNDDPKHGYYQYHRRAGVKIGSVTPGSMCSGRAVYSTMVKAYRKAHFNYVLLSTDGIYDKLSAGSSFYHYGLKLAQKAYTNTFEKDTFQVNSNGKELDLHVLSKDDCTLSLICLSTIPVPVPVEFLREKGYENARLVRSIGDLQIYQAVLDGLPVDIHVRRCGKALMETPQTIPKRIHILNSMDSFCDMENHQYHVYPTFENVFEVSELIESCQHLEKHYDDDKQDWDNAFWLRLLQQLAELRRKLNDAHADLSEAQYDIMCVSANGDLLLYDDFVPSRDRRALAAWKAFQGYFSIIGKLVWQDTEVPLFHTTYAGQLIYDPASKAEKPFGRVLYQKEKNCLWLRNQSKESWIIGHDKNKVVEPDHMLKIVSDKSITVENDGHKREYEVIIFKETEA